MSSSALKGSVLGIHLFAGRRGINKIQFRMPWVAFLFPSFLRSIFFVNFFAVTLFRSCPDFDVL